jgi:hypothetical protein
MTYTKPKYLLSTSTYQACILLQFNESDSLSYEDLAARTAIANDLLRPNLDLLIRLKILLKEDEETYELNRKFKSPKNLKVRLTFFHLMQWRASADIHGFKADQHQHAFES